MVLILCLIKDDYESCFHMLYNNKVISNGLHTCPLVFIELQYFAYDVYVLNISACSVIVASDLYPEHVTGYDY